ADYYLCGWGQVLNAVVPAGVKKQAGTRALILLEAVAAADIPTPPPTLSAKQSAALEHLRTFGAPMEPRALARLARCGPAVVGALLRKGVARRLVHRIDSEAARASREPEALHTEDAPAPLTLNADQLQVWQPIEQAARTGPQARPDGRRRGARALVQAGLDAALPCPRRGRHARPPGEHSDHSRLGDALAGELAQCPARPIHVAPPAQSGARPSTSPGRA